MIYYGLSFFIYYSGLIYFSKHLGRKGHMVLFLSILPTFSLVMLRGNVGTDTHSYLNIISSIGKNNYVGTEVGFTYLVKLMLYLGLDAKLIILIIALMTTIVLMHMAIVSIRALLVLTFCIIPVFYLDITMNGLRYGLSFVLAGMSVAYFYRQQWLSTILLAISAILIHVSGLIVFAVMLMLANDKNEFMQWLKVITGLVMLVLLQYSIRSGLDIESKVTAYSNLSSPTVLSGIAPLVISIITLVLIKLLQQNIPANSAVLQRQFYVLLSLIFLTFIVAKFSYAGLRVQFAVLFSIFIAMQFKPDYIGDVNFRMDKRLLYLMAFIGLLGVASFLKNAYASCGLEGSPWLPYVINSDIRNFFQTN